MKTKYFIVTFLCMTITSLNAMESGQKRARDSDNGFYETTKKPAFNQNESNFLLTHPRTPEIIDAIKQSLQLNNQLLNYIKERKMDLEKRLQVDHYSVGQKINSLKAQIIQQQDRAVGIYYEITGMHLDFQQILNIAANLRLV